MAGKKAAIDPDKLRDTKLADMSASDFLQMLDASEIAVQGLSIWPEKKKVELLVEPENFGKLRWRDFEDIIVRWRGEKKKVELEPIVNPPINEKKKVELEPFLGVDPRVSIPDTVIDQLADRIETRLASRGSGR
ncbi:MAG: hypothetical protein AAF543_21970 [Pseudomonadota bacterium]